MARTQFVVDFGLPSLPSGPHDPGVELGPKGFDRVEFLISPNLGEEPKPLAKIASGGELSRVMLVMKSALGARDRIETCVFDEVDTGIGGTTADRVGMKIAQAATQRQVLCITHLPQIASRAGRHYLVEKRSEDGRTHSSIRPLDPQERIEEIARMLGGVRVTQTTLDAAKELVLAPSAGSLLQ